MTDEFNSPYKSPAAFSLNPYFIDLPELYRLGYISKSELTAAKGNEKYRCEFERLQKERIPLLLKAAGVALKSDLVRGKVEAFISDNPRIEAVAKFLSLKDKFRGSPWQKWGEGEESESEKLWQFLHYEFYREWQEVKKYANKKGISNNRN